MAWRARRVEYFHATVNGDPDEAFGLLDRLAEQGVNLLALNTVPMGPNSTQMTLFPEDPLKLQSFAKNAGLPLIGPHPALLVQGDDELGALTRIHALLHRANVDVFASSAVTDGKGYYGYVLYVRAEEAEKAAAALASS